MSDNIDQIFIPKLLPDKFLVKVIKFHSVAVTAKIREFQNKNRYYYVRLYY